MKKVWTLFLLTSFSISMTFKEWPQEHKDVFLSNCIQNAKTQLDINKAEEYCNCMLKKVMISYPEPESSKKITLEEIRTMSLKCIN